MLLRLFLNLFKTCQGYLLWHKICHDKRVNKDSAIVMLPSLDSEYNLYALLYLDDLMQKCNFRNCVVCAYDERVIDIINTQKIMFSRPVSVKKTKRRICELIMQYAVMLDFDKRLFIVSLDEPEGRIGKELIASGKTTAEELIILGIYNIFPFEHHECPPILKEAFKHG